MEFSSENKLRFRILKLFLVISFFVISINFYSKNNSNAIIEARSLYFEETTLDNLNWEQSIAKTDSLFELKKYDLAISIGNELLENVQTRLGQEDTIVAEILYKLGIYNEEAINYPIAESLSRRALLIQEKHFGKDSPQVGNTLILLGTACGNQGKYVESEQLYKRALKILESAHGPDHKEVAHCLNKLAIVCRSQDKNEEAKNYFNRSLKIYESIFGNNHNSVATILNNLSNLHANEGRHKLAETYYFRCKEIYENLYGDSHPNTATIYNNLACLYHEVGKYSEAEKLFKRALDIREKFYGPVYRSVATTLGNLATVYQDQGRYLKAEPLYLRSLSINEEILGKAHLSVGTSLDILGNFYRIQGKYSKAEDHIIRALEIIKKRLGQNHSQIAISINNLAAISHDLGKFEKAETLYNKALSMRIKIYGTEHLYVAESNKNLARLYYDWGKYELSEPLYKQALVIKENLLGSTHPIVGEIQQEIAKLYASEYDSIQSAEYYEKSWHSRQEFIEHVFSSSSENQKLRWIKKYPLIDNSLLSLALQQKNQTLNKTALKMILYGKSAVIDAILAEKEAAYCNYDEDIMKMLEDRSSVCNQIANLILFDQSKNITNSTSDSLKKLYAVQDSIEQELSVQCSEFKNEITSTQFNLNQIASNLPSESVLWEFIKYEPFDFYSPGTEKERTGKSRYAVFSLNHNGEVSALDLGESDHIDSLIMATRKMIYDSETRIYSHLAPELELQLKDVTSKLYKLIFEPLAKDLQEQTSIQISLDGQLHLLPLDILPIPDGSYVIEKYRLSYLSSGKDLLKSNTASSFSNDVVIITNPDYNRSIQDVSNQNQKTFVKNINSISQPVNNKKVNYSARKFIPLLYCQNEKELIVNTFIQLENINIYEYSDEYATESVIKQLEIFPRILHIATHGYYNNNKDFNRKLSIDHPFHHSGIVLAGANNLFKTDEIIANDFENGILTAYEVSSLNLQGTELVTLSACETGLGETLNGEGVFGLRRAFKHAGAQSILMSLWRVQDKETSVLMDGFYRRWLMGNISKQDALHNTSLNILDNCRKKWGHGHPLFWGGFILAGNNN